MGKALKIERNLPYNHRIGIFSRYITVYKKTVTYGKKVLALVR